MIFNRLLVIILVKDSLVAQMIKNPFAMWETWIWFLGCEVPLEEGMATYFSILAWRTPLTEEPSGLWSYSHKELDTNKVIEYTHTIITYHKRMPQQQKSIVLQFWKLEEWDQDIGRERECPLLSPSSLIAFGGNHWLSLTYRYMALISRGCFLCVLCLFSKFLTQMLNVTFDLIIKLAPVKNIFKYFLIFWVILIICFTKMID